MLTPKYDFDARNLYTTPDAYAAKQEADGLGGLRCLTICAFFLTVLLTASWAIEQATKAPKATPAADVAGVWRPWSGEDFTDKK